MGRIIIPEADKQLDVKHSVLDHGFVSLTDYMGGDQRIAEAAWVSSIDEVEAEKKTASAMKRIINYMMENDHGTPFEMVDLCFRCKLPIFVARQWIRHRMCSYNEMSGRYRILPSESYLPNPSRIQGKGKLNKQGSDGEVSWGTKTDALETMRRDVDQLYDSYRWYDEQGIANEIARLNLPLSQYTEWYWKVNLRSFLHFSSLRRDSHAQWEIRQYADKMYELVWTVAPMACTAWEEYRFNAVTFSRSEMAVIQLMIEGKDFYEAINESGISEKRAEKLKAKVGR